VHAGLHSVVVHIGLCIHKQNGGMHAAGRTAHGTHLYGQAYMHDARTSAPAGLA
jgi:hypothetical protein